MTAEQGSPEWLAARRNGIGGSEISALYRKPDGSCAHPWMTPTRLWGLKTGQIQDDQPDPWEAPHLYVGRMLEEPVRRMYELYSGRSVSEGVTLLADPEAPVLLASTDGAQRCEDREGEGVYEGKVTTVFRRSDWIERVDGEDAELTPLHYVCQTQHYMACTGLAWASVVAFMQGDRHPIHWRDIERHEGFVADMRERASRWWRDHVVAGNPPPVDDDPKTEKALRQIHRKADDIAAVLPASFAAVLDRLDAIADLRRMIDSERQHLRNLVISTMGRASLGVIAGEDRGWSLRGETGRTLRRVTGRALERARDKLEQRPAYVDPQIAAELDALYRISMQSLAPGQCLSAKAVHLSHLAVLAAHKHTE